MLEIDHVIAVVADLDRAGDELWDLHGLGSVAGGRHIGHGTGNRIIPLGTTYIELMAVVDPEEASGSPLGRAMAASTIPDTIHLRALCLRTDDIGPIAARLGEHPAPMHRITPDGTRLGWRLAGLAGMLGSGRLPFFIEWEPGKHPGAAPVEHREPVTGLSAVTIGDPGALFDLVDPVEDVSIVEGHGVMGVTVDTASGSISLG